MFSLILNLYRIINEAIIYVPQNMSYIYSNCMHSRIPPQSIAAGFQRSLLFPKKLDLEMAEKHCNCIKVVHGKLGYRSFLGTSENGHYTKTYSPQ